MRSVLKRMLFKWWKAGQPVAVLLLLLTSGCVTLTHTRLEKFDRGGGERLSVLVLPMDVKLYEIDAGGVAGLRADWSMSAQKNLFAAMSEKLSALNVDAVPFVPPPENSPEAGTINDLQNLHSAVGKSIELHLYTEGYQLPSKKGRLDWSLGPEVGLLREKYKSDYALFIHVNDSYANSGRVVYGVAIAMIFGVVIPMGQQRGFASLVDLKSGEVVWYNRLKREGGDLRDLPKARETTELLLAGMPR